MRLSIRLLVVLLLGGVGLGRHCLAESPGRAQIAKLVIESGTLPDADRRQVIHEFQHHTYYQYELSIRIQYALRNLGYARAVVDEPTFSFTTAERGERVANVTVNVNEGTQYRLGRIEFEDTKLFPTSQMRRLFALKKGDLYDASKIVDGFENLRRLYEAAGYAEVVVDPQEERNEQLRTIDLVLDVQKGWKYYFGHLILDGLEPHAGAGRSLLNSWKTLQGKQYSPIVLQQWLMTNRSDWQAGRHKCDPITQMPDGESRVVNMKLSFPQINPFGSH